MYVDHVNKSTLRCMMYQGRERQRIAYIVGQWEYSETLANRLVLLLVLVFEAVKQSGNLTYRPL
jgi:hypothetical protein